MNAHTNNNQIIFRTLDQVMAAARSGVPLASLPAPTLHAPVDRDEATNQAMMRLTKLTGDCYYHTDLDIHCDGSVVVSLIDPVDAGVWATAKAEQLEQRRLRDLLENIDFITLLNKPGQLDAAERLIAPLVSLMHLGINQGAVLAYESTNLLDPLSQLFSILLDGTRQLGKRIEATSSGEVITALTCSIPASILSLLEARWPLQDLNA